MKKRPILMFAAVLFAVAALAGEEKSEQIRVVVTSDDGSGPVEIELDGDSMGFALDDLADGEARTLVDEGGQTVIVKRAGKDYEFTVDGKTIDLPGAHRGHDGDGMQHVFMVRADVEGEAEGEQEVDVKVIRLNEGDANGLPDDILIFSGSPLSDSVREDIRAVIKKSGHPGAVNFIDRDDAGRSSGEWHSADGKKVKVIKRKVEISQ
jgi:hypothetical protein